MSRSPLWKRRAGIALALVGLLGALSWVLQRSGPWAPVRVTVARVEVGTVQPALVGIGVVEARRSQLLGPTTTARVLKVHVDVGDPVHAGQLLAELDPVDLEQRLAALDASLERGRSLLAAGEAQSRDARARRELADANLRRYADLSRSDFISAGALEARQQEQRSTEAGLQASEASLVAARQDLQRLAAERAGLVQQRDRLRLVAPAAGVVASREAEPGSTVVAGQAVLKVIDPASLWLKVRFDQGRAAALASGQSARVLLRSHPGEALPGQVARLEPLGDAVTEERVAQVRLEAPPAGLMVGELAEVTVQLPAAARAPWVSNAALMRHEGQLGVWKLVDGKPAFAPVRTGAIGLDGRVQLLAGLAEGETVVVHSQKLLAPGTRVQVVEKLLAAGGRAVP
ncbi:MAG: efflux RND transporter periplasmic adaptor subunit [Burkholderiales bacterium]|jgi:HlyD family secretion protein|nr:efflux RND transporter periplasmic adaptor subunit [Burkholderiales bacterium]MBP6250279.1 efflux RND transporter periplasmic adaptor subunit [Leptothrix sp. (in: b-proteobacteria)]MBP7521651.1 efflux RND transporter periplasmic adaptor subunit [Leptothrix sp. (in: b-proteobacteria)]HQY09760.1 efflux RND transporter periplasmic adaptor subunit [Burkholderiaceae bacterium]